jgi:hypothetical protein
MRHQYQKDRNSSKSVKAAPVAKAEPRRRSLVLGGTFLLDYSCCLAVRNRSL